MALLLEWREEIHFSCVCVVETALLLLLLLLILFYYLKRCCIFCILLWLFNVVVVMFQNCQVIVTSLGYCWYSKGSPQSPNCWSFCNVWRKIGAGILFGEVGAVAVGLMVGVAVGVMFFCLSLQLNFPNISRKVLVLSTQLMSSS